MPSGTLGAYIVLDTNSNGYTDLGELSSDVDRSSNFAVSGNTTRNFTLSSASTKATVGTHFFSDGTSPATYSLQMEVNEGTKRPVNVTLVSGANVAVPLDMGKNQEFRAYQSLNTTAPMVGDTYVFKVTFSDGTTETVSRSVSAVPGLSAMAQNLLPQTTTPGTPTVPLFTWAAPSSPPLSYTYDVWVSNSTAGGSVWNTHDGGLPSTTTSVLYNADGKASSPSLTSGTTYYWQVTVEDANGNQATKQTTYVP